MRELELLYVSNGINAANPVSKIRIRSNLKVIVKSTLRQYVYPPDMQLHATEKVLKQAEMINDILNIV